jgi:hypothetical protein
MDENSDDDANAPHKNKQSSSTNTTQPTGFGEKLYPSPKKAVFLGKPVHVLPEVTETLVARNVVDKGLILAVPGAMIAYLNDLRASIPDGTQGPDGDLLSMVICNKFGELANACKKCGDELADLYEHVD